VCKDILLLTSMPACGQRLPRFKGDKQAADISDSDVRIAVFNLV